MKTFLFDFTLGTLRLLSFLSLTILRPFVSIVFRVAVLVGLAMVLVSFFYWDQGGATRLLTGLAITFGSAAVLFFYDSLLLLVAPEGYMLMDR